MLSAQKLRICLYLQTTNIITNYHKQTLFKDALSRLCHLQLLLRHRSDCFLTIEDFSEGIKYLLENPAKSKILRKNAYMISSNFLFSKIVDILIQIYNR